MAEEFSTEEIVKDLEKFVYYVANAVCCDAIGMELDDVVSECNMEILKGMEYYKSKKLNREQLHAVLRRMIDNRISELKYKYFLTYRKSYQNTISLNFDLEITISNNRVMRDEVVGYNNGSGMISIEGDPVQISESRDNVEMTRSLLPENVKKLFDMVIYDSDLLQDMNLTNTDKMLRYKKVAEMLGMQENEVKSAFINIRNAYAEVLNA